MGAFDLSGHEPSRDSERLRPEMIQQPTPGCATTVDVLDTCLRLEAPSRSWPTYGWRQVFPVKLSLFSSSRRGAIQAHNSGNESNLGNGLSCQGAFCNVAIASASPLRRGCRKTHVES